MTDAQRRDTRRVAAYSLLLSLHRYGKWVSGWRTAPSSGAGLADQEVRLMLSLADEHFAVLRRHISNLAEYHCALTELADGRIPGSPQGSQELDQAARRAIQGEAVNRLVSMVEEYLKAPLVREFTGVAGDVRAASNEAGQRPN